MPPLPGRPTSLWMATAAAAEYPPLEGDLHADVAVVGAGITGLTTAALLKQAGARVAVLEARQVGSGVTGHTTAKITCLHGLGYSRLLQTVGRDGAACYAAANQAAVERIADLVRAGNIDCDLVRAPAYTYAEAEGTVGAIQAEVAAASDLGLPVTYTADTDLPYPVRAAVRLDGQAHFHPRKYLLGLASQVHGGGSAVFERSMVVDVDAAGLTTVVTDGGRLTAGHVVLATHLPFLDRGFAFAKTAPEQSYVLAVRVAGQAPTGMYLSADEPTRSIRRHPSVDGDIVLIGGQSHKTGQDPDTARHYRSLERFARERFDVTAIDYRWSAHDYMPADGVPYVGRLAASAGNLYIATGFNKWGITNGTAAAMILTDAITGRENPWSRVFEPNRVNLAAAVGTLLAHNADTARRFAADRLRPDVADLDQITPGQGKTVRLGGQMVAAFRDDQGTVHAVSAVCTHLACVVAWNSAEATWDCPCHGSRFGTDGGVLHGPAVRSLRPVELPDR